MIDGKTKKSYRSGVRLRIEYYHLLEYLKEEDLVESLSGLIHEAILDRAINSDNSKLKSLSKQIKEYESSIAKRETRRMFLADKVSGYTFKTRIKKKLVNIVMNNLDDSDEELRSKLSDILDSIEEEGETYRNSKEISKFVNSLRVKLVEGNPDNPSLQRFKHYLSREYKKLKYGRD